MSKWDLYDKNFNNTGIIINDTDEIPEDKYHYSINLWTLNSKKQFISTQKNPKTLAIVKKTTAINKSISFTFNHSLHLSIQTNQHSKQSHNNNKYQRTHFQQLLNFLHKNRA